MNLLLDTHVFIWWSISPKHLSSQVEKLIADVDNALFLSLASIWEMQIKIQLGKLKLDLPLSDLIYSQKQVNKLKILPIELSHIWTLDGLPNHHKDPFDRILIAQAIAEKMPILSVDSIFDSYPIQRLW